MTAGPQRAPRPCAGSAARMALAGSAAVFATWLTACSTPTPQPAAVGSVRAAGPASVSPSHDTAPPASAALLAFEAQLRQAAQSAVAQGRWFDAAGAWDVLLALHPNDSGLQKLHDQAIMVARSEATERARKAKIAQQRGDADSAWRLYLEVLALQPGHDGAISALRTLDRERGRRPSFANTFSQLPARPTGNLPSSTGHSSVARTSAPTVRADKAATPGAANKAANGQPSRQNNDIEHASILATQGEIDSAITLLLPHAQARDENLPARRLLADLYFRQAEKLPAAQGQAVLVALKRSLVFDPSHTRAQQRLAQLQTGASTTTP